MRALPKIETAGWIACSRSVAVTNSAIISNIRHASRAELCERFTSWGSDGLGTLGDVRAMAVNLQMDMNDTKKRLLLVDAPSYFYRAFHALPEFRSPSGEPTGAILGVVNMLRKLKQDFPSDYIAAVLDPKGKTFRDAIYPEYKATRQAMPEPLSVQIEPMIETIRALGWPVICVDGVEADDVIGTLVRHAERHGWNSVISTGDKDLTQLVNDCVTWVNTMAVPMEKLDREGVRAKFGVPPEKIIDYLALMGDAVDNVPGVDKVGPKTACKLIEQYGSLEGVIAHADEIKGVVGENLRRVKDWLPTGRQLLTVKTDVALPFEIESLNDKGPDVAKLSALYERFGFRTLRDALVNREDAAEHGDSRPGTDPEPGKGVNLGLSPGNSENRDLFPA